MLRGYYMVFYTKNNKNPLPQVLKNSKKKIKNDRTRGIFVCYNDTVKLKLLRGVIWQLLKEKC